MAKILNATGTKASKKVKRKGVHAKTKTSASKSAKNYSKPYNGQGR